MTDLLIWAAVAIGVIVAVGLVRVLRGPTRADSMLAAQLLGSGSIAVLLLLAVATETSATVDVAMALALLSAFGGVAFVFGSGRTK